LTVTVSSVCRVTPPDVPVMVTMAVPTVAVPKAISVNVLLDVVLAGLNDAVTPLGRPEADKLTLPLKVFCGVIVIVLDPLLPWTIFKLTGEADILKSGAAVPGQLLTRFATLIVPIPVAKSQPVLVL